jgi:broad specificity phosphatase PhoE
MPSLPHSPTGAEGTVSLFLVRHARAGSRQRWAGDDDLRPLSAKGEQQAKALVPALEPYGVGEVTRIFSSPSLRCIQTVEPLAEQLRLTVEPIEELAEGQGPEPLALARKWLKRDVVACSHGDVIPFILDVLVPDLAELPCAKGSTWILERTTRGEVKVRYVPPPV